MKRSAVLLLLLGGAFLIWQASDDVKARVRRVSNGPVKVEKGRGEEEAAAARPGEPAVESDAPSARTIRWKILPGDFGVPPDGTRIRLRPIDDLDSVNPPNEGILRNGWLIVAGWSAETQLCARATGPGNIYAQLEAGESPRVGKAVAFQRGHCVEVRLREADGRPVRGIAIGLTRKDEYNWDAEVSTDADGIARFEALPSEFASLYVLHGPGDSRGQTVTEWIGRVDLRGRDTAVVYTLRPRVRLDVRLIQGRQKFPFDEISGTGLLVDTLQFDASSGRLTGWIVPQRGETHLDLGYENRLRFTVATLELPAPAGVWAGDIPIRSGTLRIEGRGKAPENDVWLTLVRIQDKQRELDTMWNWSSGLSVEITAEPGTYELRTDQAGAVVARAQLAPGGEATLIADASSLERVVCHVLGPDGKPASGAEVRISESDWLEEGIYVGGGSFFHGLVAKGARYRLRVKHESLIPHPTLGAYERVGGREDIVLRLVEGPTTLVSLPQRFGALKHVYLLRGEKEFELALVRDGERWRFTGYVPGRCSLWLEPERGAPVVMRDIDLGAAGNDLGTLEPRPGSTLRVRVRVDEGFVAPAFTTTVYRQTAPELCMAHRVDSENGETRVGQLPAGVYQVFIDSAVPVGDREITLNGTDDAELVFDLRR